MKTGVHVNIDRYCLFFKYTAFPDIYWYKIITVKVVNFNLCSYHDKQMVFVGVG